jgi:hypothetical protein
MRGVGRSSELRRLATVVCREYAERASGISYKVPDGLLGRIVGGGSLEGLIGRERGRSEAWML